MSVATLAFTLVAVIVAAHSITFALEARWHQKRSYVLTHGEGDTVLARLDDGLAKHDAMVAVPPWYVRYNRWITRSKR